METEEDLASEFSDSSDGEESLSEEEIEEEGFRETTLGTMKKMWLYGCNSGQFIGTPECRGG